MECKNEHFRHILLFYEQRSGRPNEVDDDRIKAIIESDRHVTVREFKEILTLRRYTCPKRDMTKFSREIFSSE